MLRFSSVLGIAEAVADIADNPVSAVPNSAENEEKPFRATLLAEPFPGTMAQGYVCFSRSDGTGYRLWNWSACE